MNRREARQVGRLAGKGINALTDKAEQFNAKAREDARNGDSALTRSQLSSAAMFRRQAEKAEAQAAEAEAKGKTGAAERHRKTAARAHRHADEREAKAAAEAERLKAKAAEQDD